MRWFRGRGFAGEGDATRSCGGSEGEHAFEGPGAGEAADRVGEGGAAEREARCEAGGEGGEQADEDREGDLAELDAEVEGGERGQDCVVRQAELGERAGEAEPVQETAGQREAPGCPRGQVRPEDLAGQDDQRDGDAGLDRRGREAHEVQGREREGEAVRGGEGRQRGEDAGGAADPQGQADDEQQVVEAAEDVRDAEVEVAGEGGLASLVERERGGGGADEVGARRGVGGADVGDELEVGGEVREGELAAQGGGVAGGA
jgi:hypothetical protein